MANQFPDTPNFNFDLHAPLRDLPDNSYTPADMGSGLATSVQARNSYVSSTTVSERLSNANELEKIFKQYDRDGSQRIDKAELRSMLRDLGMDSSNEDVQKLMGEADNVTSDGQINFAEFYQAYYKEMLPANFKSQYGIDVYASGAIVQLRSSQTLNLSPPKINLSYNLPTITQETGLRGGNNIRFSQSNRVVQETPSEISALYAVISKMQAHDVGTGDEQKMRLRSLVEQLIQDYNSNDQMSKEATINIARSMIGEFEGTLTQISDLKIQISACVDQKTSLESQYAYFFEQIKVSNQQLDEKIAAHRAYCSELHTVIQTDQSKLVQKKVTDDETHKVRLNEVHGQVNIIRQQTQKEIQDHEGYLKGDYNGKVNDFTQQLNAEKAAVIEERRQLEFYIQSKKGELSDAEKIQEALLRTFRQGVEDEKAKLMGHASQSREVDVERLRGAKTQYGIGDESERMKIHNAEKHTIMVGMDQMNKAWQAEKEAFAKEKADWMLQHEQWKKQQLQIIHEERSEMIRMRSENDRQHLSALEQQKADADREFSRLSQELNVLRIKINETKSSSLTSINAWLVEERRKLESRYAELQITLAEKQNQFKANEGKIKSDLQSEASELYREQALYQAEFKQWSDEWNILIDRARELSQIVNLNVGGRNVSVSVANLTSVRHSKLEMFFKDMNRHNLLKKDTQGRIFLDRDPKYFEHMLNFIANNGHHEQIKDEFENAMFMKELEFWGINAHSEFIDRHEDHSGKKFSFKTMDTSGNKQQAQLRYSDSIRTEF